MPAIGYVKKTASGFEGNLKTLTISTPIALFASPNKTADSHPDYRVMAGTVEIGAAWNRVSKTSGKAYVNIKLAAPEFGPNAMYANLGTAAGQDDPDVMAIIWNPAD